MAKSLRSKVKRDFRSKKRETGIYAATDAARLARLNAKLIEITKEKPAPVPSAEQDSEEIAEDIPALEGPEGAEATQPDAMAVDAEPPKKVSTHGPRGSRRDSWREAKGLPARNASTHLNRQGIVVAKRKAGRSKRRR